MKAPILATALGHFNVVAAPAAKLKPGLVDLAVRAGELVVGHPRCHRGGAAG